MRKGKSFSIIFYILSIIIIIAVGYATVKVLFGEDGIVRKYKEVETEFNKNEVVEEMNFILKEKYFGDSKYAQENKQKIEDIYNEEYAFNYLIENKYIEPLKDIEDNLVQDQYYINTDLLTRDIGSGEVKANGSKGNGTKVFKVKKEGEKYNICFVNSLGEEEMLGELVLMPSI